MSASAPNDNLASRFPVSVKGVVLHRGLVPLLFNERGEWELPGGKLERGEDPQACLVREIAEELSLAVAIERILDSWLYIIAPGVEVVIVSYGCRSLSGGAPRLSHEHKALRLFHPGEVCVLPMPDGYKRAIRAFTDHRPAV